MIKKNLDGGIDAEYYQDLVELRIFGDERDHIINLNEQAVQELVDYCREIGWEIK